MMTKTKQRVITILSVIALAISAIITINLNVMAANAAEYTETPQITILTHGWGANAGYWSNKDGMGGAFAQDYDSLLYKLSEKAGGANIYRARTKGGNIGRPVTSYMKIMAITL